ncbi:unnamed protein product, partial [marine sediment metagenome]
SLTDSGESWITDEWVGFRIFNTTDGSAAMITSNTGTTVTATLSGGTDNDWDTNDSYDISADYDSYGLGYSKSINNIFYNNDDLKYDRTMDLDYYSNNEVVQDYGKHDGGNGASSLTDSGESWTTDEWVDFKVYNITDGSSGVITANTGTTVTATLSGGVDNDWDTDDEYEIRGLNDFWAYNLIGKSGTESIWGRGGASDMYKSWTLQEIEGGAFDDNITFQNNIEGNPLFVDPASLDYHLKQGSPCINTGGHLTTVHANDTGSGLTLKVADARFF